MVAEDILKEVGLSFPGSYNDDGDFIVHLNNDTEFGKAYAAFDHSERFEPAEGSKISADSIVLTYEDAEGECEVTVSADFMQDEYSIVISEV